MGTMVIPFIESRTELGQPSTTSSELGAKEAAFQAANAALGKKAKSTVVLYVKEVTLIAEYFVFTGGESKAQVKAIAEEIAYKLGQSGRKAKAMEGMVDGRWVLLDFGDVIIHILQEKERDYYKLEQFWNQGLVVAEAEWSEDHLEEGNTIAGNTVE